MKQDYFFFFFPPLSKSLRQKRRKHKNKFLRGFKCQVSLMAPEECPHYPHTLHKRSQQDYAMQKSIATCSSKTLANTCPTSDLLEKNPRTTISFEMYALHTYKKFFKIITPIKHQKAFPSIVNQFK